MGWARMKGKLGNLISKVLTRPCMSHYGQGEFLNRCKLHCVHGLIMLPTSSTGLYTTGSKHLVDK